MANKTRSELRTEVLARLGETTGFYQESEINQWIQDGIDDIAVSIEPLLTSATAAAVADQREYTLPSDVLSVKKVLYGGSGNWVEVEETQYETLFETIPDWEDDEVDGTATKPPTKWYWRGPSTLGLYPLIQNNLSNGIRIIYTYKPAPMSGDSSTSGLPEWFDKAVAVYAVMRCYLKDSRSQRAQEASQEYIHLVDQGAMKLNKHRKNQAPQYVPDTKSYRQFYNNRSRGSYIRVSES